MATQAQVDAGRMLEKALEEQRHAQRKADEWATRVRDAGFALNRARQAVAEAEYPHEPGGQDPVVRFRKRYVLGTKVYSFAAIKGGGLWYVTGASTHGMSWRALCDFARKDNVLTSVPILLPDEIAPPF